MQALITPSSNAALAAVWTKTLHYITDNLPEILGLCRQHLEVTGVAIVAAILAAVPLGIFLAYQKKLAAPLLGLAGLLQTIPSLALLAMMIPLFGIGFTPSVVMLFLYSLLPILRNTYTGINEVTDELVLAARGMGMTNAQIILKVQMPIATPIIIAGIRTASVICVGTATLAALIGFGGLGSLIYRGISQIKIDLIVTGALFSALLALAVDGLFSVIEYAITPKGLRTHTQ
ncbi:MAG: ABC transporter permease [Clostridiales bacterium]|nr:ABC transporter permease [Clostridiales bacterium]